DPDADVFPGLDAELYHVAQAEIDALRNADRAIHPHAAEQRPVVRAEIDDLGALGGPPNREMCSTHRRCAHADSGVRATHDHRLTERQVEPLAVHHDPSARAEQTARLDSPHHTRQALVGSELGSTERTGFCQRLTALTRAVEIDDALGARGSLTFFSKL